MLERDLIDDSTLPITTYNYSAIRNRLAKRGIRVALSTVIDRARGLGCYQPHPRKKVHDREVVTTAIGALIQHDASHHRWSPYAGERWVLITSLDDFSRKLLYAELFEQETTWAHIKAAKPPITQTDVVAGKAEFSQVSAVVQAGKIGNTTTTNTQRGKTS